MNVRCEDLWSLCTFEIWVVTKWTQRSWDCVMLSVSTVEVPWVINLLLSSLEWNIIGLNANLRKKFSEIGGHSGVKGTWERTSKFCWWPTMRQDMATYVRECEVCQQQKHEHVAYPGLLQPLHLRCYMGISLPILISISLAGLKIYLPDSYMKRGLSS